MKQDSVSAVKDLNIMWLRKYFNQAIKMTRITLILGLTSTTVHLDENLVNNSIEYIQNGWFEPNISFFLLATFDLGLTLHTTYSKYIKVVFLPLSLCRTKIPISILNEKFLGKIFTSKKFKSTFGFFWNIYGAQILLVLFWYISHRVYTAFLA